MKTHPHTFAPPLESGQMHEQEMHIVQPLPRYLRLPRSGKRCPHTGLSRSALNSMILGHRPLVKSISLGARHNVRGTRLICGESLAAYLQSLEKELAGSASNGNPQQEEASPALT